MELLEEIVMSKLFDYQVPRLESNLEMQIETINALTRPFRRLRGDAVRMILGNVVIAGSFLMSLSQSATAQEWNQWRGPSRDGQVPATSTPSAWPESLRRVWRVEIGEGYAS